LFSIPKKGSQYWENRKDIGLARGESGPVLLDVANNVSGMDVAHMVSG
jgi:hypothetical protein